MESVQRTLLGHDKEDLVVPIVVDRYSPTLRPRQGEAGQLDRAFLGMHSTGLGDLL